MSELPFLNRTQEKLQPAQSSSIAEFLQLDGNQAKEKHYQPLLEQLIADKGFSYDAIHSLLDMEIGLETVGLLGGLFNMMKGQERVHPGDMEKITNALRAAKPNKQPHYRGTAEENEAIDTSLHQRFPTRFGKGTARSFDMGGSLHTFITVNSENHETLSTIPITIMGAGPAGIMMARALVDMGFKEVTIIDEQGEFKGLWNYPNVARASKNNPYNLSYHSNNTSTRLQATGDKNTFGTGQEVVDFLEDIIFPPPTALAESLPQAVDGIAGKIISVSPERNDAGMYEITYYDKATQQNQTHEAALVINTLGKGKYKDPTKGPMTTDAASAAQAKHWQEIILDREKLKQLMGKHFTFVGLGNSTLEMVRQIQYLNQHVFTRNNRITFTILTHYTEKQFEPKDDRKRALYRDLSIPDLTGVAGDIPEVDAAMQYALEEGAVKTNVAEWHYDRDMKKVAFTTTDGTTHEASCDNGYLYTLIGYGRTQEEFAQLGILADQNGNPYSDYDGEYQRAPGATGITRVMDGYFGLGGTIATDTDTNAEVIPGMLFRMRMMMPSVLVRAQEHVNRFNPKRQDSWGDARRRRKARRSENFGYGG